MTISKAEAQFRKNQNRVNSISTDDAEIVKWMAISDNKLKIMVHFKRLDTWAIENVVFQNDTDESPEFTEIHKSKTYKEINGLF